MENNTLSTRQLAALRKKLTYVLALTPQSKICDFLELFFRCEVMAKILIDYYRRSRNITGSRKYDSYSVNQVKSAAKSYSLSISNTKIEQIFKSGDGSSGNKTCRQLRNGYVHSLSNGDKQEIETRFDELKGYMEDWITALESHSPALN